MRSVEAERRRYRVQVESLLGQIREQVRELRRLQAAGVRGRGLVERKRELTRIRARLAEVVATAPAARAA